ncbi:MAG: AraC family transcriptional regulator [Treponema sp.]|nr:AraC family transcriptional regulator [Treponema sp.]
MYRVLLVDDDPLALSGVKGLIDWEKNNCIILGTATNGNAALALMRKTQTDVVICDITMPGITGLDVLKQAYTEFPGTVFIMLTNQDDFTFARESLHYRVAEYLVKNELEAAVLEKALERAITEYETRNKLHRIDETDTLLAARIRQDLIQTAIEHFLRGPALLPNEMALLMEEGMLSNFAFAFIPINYAILPEYPYLPEDGFKKIFTWEMEIAKHLAGSFFSHVLLLPCPPRNIYHDLLLFAWNLQPHTWDSDITRFKEQLVKTSGQITRLGVDLIASDFFESEEAEKSPGQALFSIEDQYYRKKKGMYSEAVQKALQYVLNHIEERIMLQDVADFANISPGYLSTLFKREFNQSLMDFINQTKIDTACELLRKNTLRINEIAHTLGYENAFYFSRLFRQYTGLKPSEYRAKVMNEN